MIKFTLPECAAIVSEFDKDNSGSVDYAEFLTSFFQLAFNHKKELAMEHDYAAHKVREKMEKEEEVREEGGRRKEEPFAFLRRLEIPHNLPFHSSTPCAGCEEEVRRRSNGQGPGEL